MAWDERSEALNAEREYLRTSSNMPSQVWYTVLEIVKNKSMSFREMLTEFSGTKTCEEMLLFRGMGKKSVSWIRLWCYDNDRKMKCGCPGECPHRESVRPEIKKRLSEIGYPIGHFRAGWMDKSNQELAAMFLEQFDKNEEIEIKLEHEKDWAKELEAAVHSARDELHKVESSANDLARSIEEILRATRDVDNR